MSHSPRFVSRLLRIAHRVRADANLRSGRSQRGAAFIEFLFCSLIWVPLLLGVMVFGINIIEAMNVSQLSRNSGHMYAFGIDFSQAQNLAYLQKMAGPLNITQSGGEGAVLLSKVTLVTDSDCAAMQACPNNGKYVFTGFFLYGNASYATTQLGSPKSSYLTSTTPITAAQYLTDPSLVATGFSSLLTFTANQPGQYAYISEVWVNSQVVNFAPFSNTGSYARSIF